MNKKNPHPKGSRSYNIWEKNNNPKNKLFWQNVFANQIADRDVCKVQEALDNVER